MVEFKVGDRVRRINSEYAHEGMRLGRKYTVSKLMAPYHLKVEGNDRWYSQHNFELVKPKKRKKHLYSSSLRKYMEKGDVHPRSQIGMRLREVEALERIAAALEKKS